MLLLIIIIIIIIIRIHLRNLVSYYNIIALLLKAKCEQTNKQLKNKQTNKKNTLIYRKISN